MAMSDCPRCWNTPCTCGYMGYTVTRLPGKSEYDRDREIAELRDEIRKLKEGRNEQTDLAWQD